MNVWNCSKLLKILRNLCEFFVILGIARDFYAPACTARRLFVVILGNCFKLFENLWKSLKFCEMRGTCEKWLKWLENLCGDASKFCEMILLLSWKLREMWRNAASNFNATAATCPCCVRHSVGVVLGDSSVGSEGRGTWCGCSDWVKISKAALSWCEVIGCRKIELLGHWSELRACVVRIGSGNCEICAKKWQCLLRK